VGQFTHNGVVYEELPNGKVRPVAYANPLAGATPVGGADPMKPLQVQGAQMGLRKDQIDIQQAPLDAQNKQLSGQKTAQEIKLDNFKTGVSLKQQYDKDARVQTYRDSIPQVAGAMDAPNTPQGDLSVVYAFAKVMDPASAVRGEEMDMARGSSPIAAQIKAYLGLLNSGKRLPPETRRGLVDAMRTKAQQYEAAYASARDEYQGVAEQGGFDPKTVIGDHDGKKFNDIERRFIGVPRTDEDFRSGIEQRLKAGDDPANVIKWLIDSGRPPNKDTIAAIIANAGNPTPDVRPPDQSGFASSPLGQGLSGANEGLAAVLGAPADLAAGAINAATGGINALAGTQLPKIDNPLFGSGQIEGGLKAIGAINAPTPGGMFARRVGQSVGAAAVPLGGAMTTPARYGAQLLMGAGGGIGGATAQQAFPGNPLAEIGGELIGGGLTAGGITQGIKRAGQKQIEAAVPTVPQLKEQAGQLYRAAESRGVVAGPAQTQRLNDDIRQTLMDEGRLSPTGRITEAYPKAKEATQLIGDYAGMDMSPTQMQSVRKVIADGLSSPEPAERRLSGMLTETFDNFANPLAPELKEARDISSRYLTAQQLQQARELAGARASQFTGSGFENALRTEYRGLDRAAIKGNAHFSNDVNNAIETVSRGTPTSNALRGLGRLAPTGPVSGMGSIMSGIGMGAMTDPITGGMFGAGMAGAGILGRAGATHMGIRAADQAELVARNGGQLPTAQIPPEWTEMMRRLAAAQTAKYLPE
jgi:hypothetical protein